MSCRLDIAVAGAGGVASSMAPALKEAGHSVRCVYSRTRESACTLADAIGSEWTVSLESLPHGVQICIVMLRDDALKSLAPDIVKACGPDTLYLHTAGSVPMSLWQEAGAKHYGVLYPMQTFSRGKQVDWQQVPVFVEASPGDLDTVRTLAESISGHVQELSSDDRCRLHIAAVFTCNFTNRMYAIAQRLLERMDVPFSVMYPLLAETAAKAQKMNPAEGQTGPAVRGDHSVMDHHLQMLADTPEWAELYKLISKDIEDDRLRS